MPPVYVGQRTDPVAPRSLVFDLQPATTVGVTLNKREGSTFYGGDKRDHAGPQHPRV